MHGMQLAQGLKESSQFIPPLFTPSTKAEVGDKDENIHPDEREPPLLGSSNLPHRAFD